MKLLILLALVVVTAEARAKPYNHYDTKYDNFEVNDLVDNPRLLCAYAKCFCGTGACTPEGNDMKTYMTEGVQTACDKCTEKQKPKVAKVMKAMRVKCPDEWKLLYGKYDPEGARVAEMEEFITKHSS